MVQSDTATLVAVVNAMFVKPERNQDNRPSDHYAVFFGISCQTPMKSESDFFVPYTIAFSTYSYRQNAIKRQSTSTVEIAVEITYSQLIVMIIGLLYNQLKIKLYVHVVINVWTIVFCSMKLQWGSLPL